MLMSVIGICEITKRKYNSRDDVTAIFEKIKPTVKAIAETLNERYGAGTVVCEVTDQYYNMAEILKDHMELIYDAARAIRECGGTPYSEPVRGGTDGSRLSFMGVPCPNLGTGGYNYHSRFEFASVQEMEQCADTLIRIAKMH